MPPIAGPTAAPRAAAAAQPTRADSPGRAAWANIGSDAHSSSAPPAPCTQRQTIRNHTALAAPEPIEASPNMPSPTISARFDPSREANGMTARAPAISARL